MSTFSADSVRITGIILMVVAVVGIIIFFLWERRETILVSMSAWLPARLRPKQIVPWKHTLEDLFKSEFPDLTSSNKTIEITTRFDQPDSEPVAFTVQIRLFQDFRSGTDFIMAFIPQTNRLDVDQKIFDLIKMLPDILRQQRDQLKRNIGFGMSLPGLPYQDSSSLAFSGRVFVYTLQPFTPIQIGELMKIYQDGGLRLEIRGLHYWYANKDR